MKMKNYLLTVIGDFETEKVCKEIALSITPLVDSPNLKFQHTKGVLVFHFATEVLKEEIFAYIQGILYGTTESFILTELTDNMTVSFPNDIKEHLLDLQNSSEDVNMKIDLNKIKRNLDFMESEEAEDWVALLLDEKEDYIKRPSLDQILDKIASKGYDSLSQFEKDTLELYSKN